MILAHRFFNDLIYAKLVGFLSNRSIDVRGRLESNERHLQSNDLVFDLLVSLHVCLEFIDLCLFLFVDLSDFLDGLPTIHEGHVDVADDKFYRLNVSDVAKLFRFNLV